MGPVICTRPRRRLSARRKQSGQTITVTRDPDVVRRAERIVLPGVGAFADCRRGLEAVDGMIEALTESVRQRGRPFLGICVGMQLLADPRSRISGHHRGLSWIAGDVAKIAPQENLKIPHMGWNTLAPRRAHPLLADVALGPQGPHAYFVHSYELKPPRSRR